MLEALTAAAANYARRRAEAAVAQAVLGARRRVLPVLAALLAAAVGLGVVVASVSTSSSTAHVGMLMQAVDNKPSVACGGGGQPAVPVTASGKAAAYVELATRASTSCTGALTAPYMLAQMHAESGFDPSVCSPVGACGLVQFMPATWAMHGIDGDGDGRAERFNPVDNAMSAAAYICELRRLVAADPTLVGDPMDLALAAYNAGLGNVKKYRGVPPFAETRGYLKRIHALAVTYGASAQAGAVAAAVEPCRAAVDQAVVGGWAAPMRSGTYRLSSGYGPRGGCGGRCSSYHRGSDLAAPIGTPIYAMVAGVVTLAGSASGYGRAVYIATDLDGDGRPDFNHRYGHVVRMHVAAGQVVAAGQLIADVGNEGRSTGPHLHVECRPADAPVDCEPYLRARGINL